MNINKISLTNNQNFYASISRSAQVRNISSKTGNKFRQATKEEVLHDYDDAIRKIGERAQLNIAIHNYFAECPHILSKLPAGSSLKNACDMYIPHENNNGATLSFITPKLILLDSKNNEIDEIALSDNPKDAYRQAYCWLYDKYGNAESKGSTKTKFVDIQSRESSQTISRDTIIALKHSKRAAERLDDFMFYNKEIQTILSKLPQKAQVIVANECRIDGNEPDGDNIKIKIAPLRILYSNGNSANKKGKVKSYNNVEMMGGYINERGIINWLKKFIDTESSEAESEAQES